MGYQNSKYRDKLRSQRFSEPPGNLFSIFTNVVFTLSCMLYLTCVYSHIVFTRNQQKLIFFNPQKKKKSPNKLRRGLKSFDKVEEFIGKLE